MIKLKPDVAGVATAALWIGGLAGFGVLNSREALWMFDSPWLAATIAIPVGMLMLAWRRSVSFLGGGPALTSGRGQVAASIVGGGVSGFCVFILLGCPPMLPYLNRSSHNDT